MAPVVVKIRSKPSHRMICQEVSKSLHMTPEWRAIADCEMFLFRVFTRWTVNSWITISTQLESPRAQCMCATWNHEYLRDKSDTQSVRALICAHLCVSVWQWRKVTGGIAWTITSSVDMSWAWWERSWPGFELPLHDYSNSFHTDQSMMQFFCFCHIFVKV